MPRKISQLDLVEEVTGEESIPVARVVDDVDETVRVPLALLVGPPGSVDNVSFDDLQGVPDDNPALATVLGDKADASAVATALADKADSSAVAAALAEKADSSAVAAALAGKAESSHQHAAGDINSGTFHADRIPALAQSKITNLATALASKADDAATTTALASKADAAATTTALGTKLNHSGGTATGLNATVVAITETTGTGSGTAFSPNLANGTQFYFTTTGNATLTLPTPVAGKIFSVTIQYGGTHTLAFAGGTRRWDDDTVPTPTSANGKRDKFVFECVDGVAWDSVHSMVNY